MNRIYIILIALLLSYIAGSAQQVPPAKKISKEERAAHIAKELSVDKNKAATIVDALDYNVARIQSTVRDSSLSPQQKRELVTRLHKEREAKIKASMSPKEYAKMQAVIAPLVAERKAKAEEYRARRLKELQQKGKAQNEVKQDKKP